MQNVLGFSAKVSGLALAPMSVSWLIASVILGKCIAKYGEKAVIVISNVILLISFNITAYSRVKFFIIISC